MKDAVQGLTSATLGRAHHRVKPKLVGLDGGSLPPAIRLRCSRVTQKTLDQYQMAIARFEQWCKHSCGRLSHSSLDGKVVRFLTFLHEVEDAEPRQGAYLIYGLQLMRCQMPKHLYLPNSKEALSSWRKLRPGSMQLPVPEEIVYDVLMEVGRTKPDLFFLGLVQFDCCLRPSEALQLCRDHVVPPVGARYNCWTIIVKLSEMGERTNKTGTADDSVVVGDIPDRRWMNKVMKFLYDRSTGKLFPKITLANYERALADACKALNYSAVIVLPHILRHSSASNDAYFKRRDLRSIQKRGRWSSRSSVARYEKHGLMLRQWKFVCKNRKALLEAAHKRLVLFLNTRLNGT